LQQQLLLSRLYRGRFISSDASIKNSSQLKSKALTKSVVAVIIFGVMCALAARFVPPGGQDPQKAMWYSVVPPVMAILLAFLTHHVLLSLGIAIVAGGLLTQVPQTPLSMEAWIEGFKTVGFYVADTLTDKTNLQILAFLPPIFVMVEIIIASGGFKGIIVWLLKWVKGKKSAQTATALMGILCFIDDYTNAIIVGSMMQPITDRFRVSREKLAFLVDATSAPIAGLAVISTWIAYEVSLLAAVGQELDIEKSGYSMFFDALSFRFYCILMIVFVFVHILTGRDFGPMKAAQERVKAKGPPEKDKAALSEGLTDSTLSSSAQRTGRALNALVPLAGLVLFHLTGLWFDGTSKLKEDMLDWQAKSLTTIAGHQKGYDSIRHTDSRLVAQELLQQPENRRVPDNNSGWQSLTLLVSAGGFPRCLRDLICNRHKLRNDGNPHPNCHSSRLRTRREHLRPDHNDKPRRCPGRRNLRRPLLAHLRHDNYEFHCQLLRPHRARSHTTALQSVCCRTRFVLCLPSQCSWPCTGMELCPGNIYHGVLFRRSHSIQEGKVVLNVQVCIYLLTISTRTINRLEYILYHHQGIGCEVPMPGPNSIALRNSLCTPGSHIR